MSALRDYYYAPAFIEHLPERVVKIRVATVVKGERGRDWEVDQRMKRALPFGGYENYQSSEDTYLLDCAGKRFQILLTVDYDNKGRVLNSEVNPKPVWASIPPGSSLATLSSYRSVCPEVPTPSSTSSSPLHSSQVP